MTQYDELLSDAEILVRMVKFMEKKSVEPIFKEKLDLIPVTFDKLIVEGEEYEQMQSRTKLAAINALNELQGRLKQWQEANFDIDCTGPEWMALGASEELGEVSHIIVKAKQKIRQHQAGLDEKSIDELADGVADTVIYLMQLCSHVGIDFGRALFCTAEEVMKRNWRENKTDGVSK